MKNKIKMGNKTLSVCMSDRHSCDRNYILDFGCKSNSKIKHKKINFSNSDYYRKINTKKIQKQILKSKKRIDNLESILNSRGSERIK